MQGIVRWPRGPLRPLHSSVRLLPIARWWGAEVLRMLEQEIGCSIRVRAEGGGELRCTRGEIRSACNCNRCFAFDPGVDKRHLGP